VLKELEVGNEEDMIDDDANSTRVDPMVVDDSDRETSKRNPRSALRLLVWFIPRDFDPIDRSHRSHCSARVTSF
jgi:hypothetical protein